MKYLKKKYELKNISLLILNSNLKLDSLTDIGIKLVQLKIIL